jgi:hypothetical protein
MDQEMWQLLARIKAEYREMPGLHLTRAQMKRLCGLTDATCDAVISTLVDQHFLARAADGAFVLMRGSV